MIRRRVLFPALLLLVATLAGCSDSGEIRADISTYGDEPITIAGLTEEEFTVTPAELAELECVSRSAKAETADKVSAAGPLLDTFLAQYGYGIEDVHAVRFISDSDYRVVLQEDYLTECEVILAIAAGEKDPLTEAERPLRILIPDLASNMWEHAVTRIEFELV